MRDEFNQLVDGNISQAYNTLMTEKMTIWWPAFPFIILIIVVKMTTKNNYATALAAILGIIAMRGSEYALSVTIHPAVYAIAVISTATALFMTFK